MSATYPNDVPERGDNFQLVTDPPLWLLLIVEAFCEVSDESVD